MISHIIGKVDTILGDSLIIDNNGIGYRIYVSDSILSSCEVGKVVKLFTYMHVKEDGISLFGFSSVQQNELFMKLITISGIGPKTALSVISAMDVNSIATAIVTGNSTLLSKVPGIGKKTAERIILELRDKVAKMNYDIDENNTSNPVLAADCISTLISLGFSKYEAEKGVAFALEQGCEKAEDIISKALSNLNKF